MKSLMSLVLAVSVSNIAIAQPCRTIMVPRTICELPVKKRVPKKPNKAITPEPIVIVPEKQPEEVVTVTPPIPPPEPKEEPTVVVVETPVYPESPTVTYTEPEETPWVIAGLRAAVGGGIRNEYDTWGHTSGLIGGRLHFPGLHLGLDAYTPFDYGAVAASVLVYPYQGDKLNWQVGVGANSTGKLTLTTFDVPRTWDMMVGTGIEYELIKNLALTVDWRMSVPNAFFIADHDDPVYDSQGKQVYGQAGRYLDVKHVLGNSFVQSQVLVGLMFRTF